MIIGMNEQNGREIAIQLQLVGSSKANHLNDYTAICNVSDPSIKDYVSHDMKHMYHMHYNRAFLSQSVPRKDSICWHSRFIHL